MKREKRKSYKKIAMILTVTLLCGLFCGCGKETAPDNSEMASEAAEGSGKQPDAIYIGSLNGPTSMGLLSLVVKSGKGETQNAYDFQMATGADELLSSMVKGELDIALVPANVASILYAKTEGNVAVIDINTLGVLYMVSGDASIQSIGDLKGKTIYLTGKGTTPDYVLHYILAENGLEESDYTLEYKSEATEVAAFLAENPEAVGLLPQPFVTAACMQNDKLSVILDMDEEWNTLQGEDGSRLVTGVTVVRKEFLTKNEEAIKRFLEDHKESTEDINANPAEGAVWAVQAGIVANEQIGENAIPKCNITCIAGEEMKQALSGYLEVLYGQNPESVGGELPGDDFYYVP